MPIITVYKIMLNATKNKRTYFFIIKILDSRNINIYVYGTSYFDLERTLQLNVILDTSLHSVQRAFKYRENNIVIVVGYKDVTSNFSLILKYGMSVHPTKSVT